MIFKYLFLLFLFYFIIDKIMQIYPVMKYFIIVSIIWSMIIFIPNFIF